MPFPYPWLKPGIGQRTQSRQNHMKASYIFSKNDVLANCGVILASILIFATGSRWPDLIIGVIITVLVFRGGLQIIAEARKEEAEQDGSGNGG